MTNNRARPQREPSMPKCENDSVFSGNSIDGIRHGALEVLRQGKELLENITESQYTSPCSFAFNATIGQHFRHCLDHFDTFLTQIGAGILNYDLRKRQPILENSPQEALRLTKEFENKILEMDQSFLTQKAILNTGVGNEELGLCETTIARELYYVTAHAIHHFALIAVIGNHLNLMMPHNFGVAPSTVAYLATKTNA